MKLCTHGALPFYTDDVVCSQSLCSGCVAVVTRLSLCAQSQLSIVTYHLVKAKLEKHLNKHQCDKKKKPVFNLYCNQSPGGDQDTLAVIDLSVLFYQSLFVLTPCLPTVPPSDHR